MSLKQRSLWVLQAQCGDREALDKLLESLIEPLSRYLRAMTASHDLADDLLQDTLITVVSRIHALREPRAFRAWAYRIASRLARRRLGRASETEFVADLDASMEDASAFREIEGRLATEAAISLISSLPRASRTVLWLHYIDELTLSEIADVLEIPLGTAKSRFAYGMEKLRSQIVEGGNEPFSPSNK